MLRNIVLAVLVALSVGCASSRIVTPVVEMVVPETPAEPMAQEVAVPAVEPLALAEEASDVPVEFPVEPMLALDEYSDFLYEALSPKGEMPVESPAAFEPKPTASAPKERQTSAVGVEQDVPTVVSAPVQETGPIVRAAVLPTVFRVIATPSNTVVSIAGAAPVLEQGVGVFLRYGLFLAATLALLLFRETRWRKRFRGEKATNEKLCAEVDALMAQLMNRRGVALATGQEILNLQEAVAFLTARNAVLRAQNEQLARDVANPGRLLARMRKKPPPKEQGQELAAGKPPREETRSPHEKTTVH